MIDLGGGCYVGAELCKINRWQLFRGDMKSEDAAAMITATVLNPEISKRKIEDAPDSLGIRNSELLVSTHLSSRVQIYIDTEN